MKGVLIIKQADGGFIQSKMAVKIGIDAAMTIILFVLMTFMVTGQRLHEYFGVAMFALFIIHNILNVPWYKNLLKGKHTSLRVIQTIINLLVMASMVGLMVSGMIMSRYVLAFASFSGAMSFARTLHMFCAYWGFVLMSLHLGMHWGMIMRMIRKITGFHKSGSPRTIILRIMVAIIGCFGLHSFVKHDIPLYMFLKSRFVYFDFEQPAYLLFTEYISIMGMWVCIAYYGSGLLRKFSATSSKINPKE